MPRALTDLAKDKCLGGTGLIMGGNKLCLVGCLGRKPRLAQSQSEGLRVCRRLGEVPTPRGEECGPHPDFASYTLAFTLKLRKIRKPYSEWPKGARLI